MLRATFSIDTDEPKLSKSLRAKLRLRIRRRMQVYSPVSKRRAEQLFEDVWPLVAQAYSAGYHAGHEDQMQMRIRDAMEAADRKGTDS